MEVVLQSDKRNIRKKERDIERDIEKEKERGKGKKFTEQYPMNP